MHENYHARWDRPGGPSEAFLWRLEIPLLVNSVPIGRLAVSAERDDQSITDALDVLVKMVELAETRAAEVATVALPTTTGKKLNAEPAVSARL
jgi:hypothetical protein